MLLNKAREAVAIDGDGSEDVIEKTLSSAWSLGPKHVGPNLMSVGKMLDGEQGRVIAPLGNPSVGEHLKLAGEDVREQG